MYSQAEQKYSTIASGDINLSDYSWRNLSYQLCFTFVGIFATFSGPLHITKVKMNNATNFKKTTQKVVVAFKTNSPFHACASFIILQVWIMLCGS